MSAANMPTSFYYLKIIISDMDLVEQNVFFFYPPTFTLSVMIWLKRIF